MFVASYARLPPGSRFHLSVNVQVFPCNALYRVFAVTIWVGSDRLLQCARYHLGRITARALYYNARYRLGTARALCYIARYRLGTARALHYNARYRLGTAWALYYNARYRLGSARALHYNARHRLGTARALYYNARYRPASVPLGPSITMRGTDTPFAFYKVLIGIGVRNFQENTKTNGKPRNATLTL